MRRAVLLGFLLAASMGCAPRRRSQMVYVQPAPAVEQAPEDEVEYADEEYDDAEYDDAEYDDTAGDEVEAEVDVTAPVMPPAPLQEVVPAAPQPGWVWVNGYWQWTGAEYVWVQGHWEAAPQPGYVYVAPGWVAVGGVYHFRRGRWVARAQPARVRYVHPRPRVVVRPGARYEVRQRGPRVYVGPSGRVRARSPGRARVRVR